MSLERFRIRTAYVLHQTIESEVVIINLDTGNYYSVLKSGADVWNAVEHGAGVREICAALARKYRMSEEVIADSIAKFIDQLQSEGLIEAFDEPDAAEDFSAPEPESSETNGPFEAPILEKFDDMQDLILLDPVHEVDDQKGWPHGKPPGKGGSKP
jgi:coenzyme PQQ synthesis protein D (PqqD)